MLAPDQTSCLSDAVSGERREFPGASGTLSYYIGVPATGYSIQLPPLLLIHSINAAGSAYEMKPLFEHYRRVRPVYAIDLPGFGFSERRARRYTPTLMTDALADMVAEIGRLNGSVSIDAMSLSLSCEFLARAAIERTSAYRTLAFISPTGFDRRAPYLAAPGTTRGMAWLYATLNAGGDRLFRLLTSRASIAYFLKKTWGSDRFDRGLQAYDYLTTHQPGARHAPYDFVSGFLFSKDITRIYEQLALPVWMTHGVRGDFIDFRYAAAFAGKRNWTIEVFQTGALPHFEMVEAFTQAYDAFLANAGRG